MSNPVPPGEPAAYPSLGDLAAAIPPVAWLWPGWIPRGMITLLCAAPGAGKSYLALDLAHRCIAGLPWPDGAPGPEPGGTVIYVDAEDAPQLLNERALAWGIDRSRLYPLLSAPGQPLDLSVSASQARLLAMAAALRPALIVVDSLGSASRGAENQVAVVDALFSFLNRVALQHQCGLLVIHHLRKRLARVPIGGEDVRGSGHIVSLARSVLGLVAVQTGLDPERNAPRTLQLLKTNLCPFPDSLGVSFVPSAGAPSGATPSGATPSGATPSGATPTGAMPSAGERSGAAPSGAAPSADAPSGATSPGPVGVRLAYGPAPQSHRPRTLVESCARWLLEYLAASPHPLALFQLVGPARQVGFSRATLFRARDLLGAQIVDTRGRNHPDNRWTLARIAPPPPKPPPSR